MKQGKPLQRKAPLRAKKPMARSQLTSTQKRRAQRKRAERREAGEHGMPWSEVRLMIHVRCGGRCEGCGKPIAFLGGMEGHHRLTRRLGPDCPCNALALCGDCHHGPEGHGGPERARELGRIISRHDERPPTEVDVDVFGQGVVRLTCGGTYT